MISVKKPRSRAYPPDDDMSLGACLKRRRLGLGWLQEEVATYLGVSVASVGSYELNKEMPKVTKRKNIVKFLKKNWWDDESGTLANRCVSYRSQEGLSIYQMNRRTGISEKIIIAVEKRRRVTKEAEERLRAYFVMNLSTK